MDITALQDALARGFSDISSDDVRIQSLATALDAWGSPPTKTATLTFATLPSAIKSNISQGQWKVGGLGLHDSLILDTHFLGLTPLNNVDPLKHGYELVFFCPLRSNQPLTGTVASLSPD